MSVQAEQQDQNTNHSTPPNNTAGLTSDGLRIFAELWVLICQIVSLVTLAIATDTPSGVTWTLLSLSVTTLITFVQFYNESSKGTGKNILLSAPCISFFVLTVILIVSSAIPEVRPFVENKIVSVFICLVIVIRQVCHIITLLQYYHNSKPTREVNK